MLSTIAPPAPIDSDDDETNESADGEIGVMNESADESADGELLLPRAPTPPTERNLNGTSTGLSRYCAKGEISWGCTNVRVDVDGLDIRDPY